MPTALRCHRGGTFSRRALTALTAVALLTLPGSAAGASMAAHASGGARLVRPTIPITPGVNTFWGSRRGNTRTFRLTASQFTQKIANFPLQQAQVWGYNGSTPGPTLITYAGQRVRVVLTNRLPVPTTIHFHGLHTPNTQDGVAGITQTPIAPGQTYTYTFVPGHTGTFAYHTHTDDGVQEMRGLDGMFIVLPRRVPAGQRVQRDFALTLQEFSFTANNQLVNPFPPGGKFNFFTINGKTGEAAGGPMVIRRGDRVRIRIYNASQDEHSMHLHGHDMVLVSKNGHPVPPTRETTQNLAPGDFAELVFTANNPGNWVFHCHFPHHTGNMMKSGWEGAPVGMTRIFHYQGYKPVPSQYFSYTG